MENKKVHRFFVDTSNGKRVSIDVRERFDEATEGELITEILSQDVVITVGKLWVQTKHLVSFRYGGVVK